jgi:hypothetical protein
VWGKDAGSLISLKAGNVRNSRLYRGGETGLMAVLLLSRHGAVLYDASVVHAVEDDPGEGVENGWDGESRVERWRDQIKTMNYRSKARGLVFPVVPIRERTGRDVPIESVPFRNSIPSFPAIFARQFLSWL